MMSPSQRVRRAALVIAALAAVLAPSAARAAASGVRAGDATVVASADPGARRVTDGGSGSQFSLRLPTGASCPGDSANDGYRVQSFLVPGSDDPGTFTYFSVSPVGEGRYALYDTATDPFIQEQTADAPHPGAPGRIINIPNFTFVVFPPGKLPGGTYRVGIACSLHNATIRYWDTEMQLTMWSRDQPGHLTWRVVGASPANESQTRGQMVALALLITGGFVTLGLWTRQRHAKADAEARR